MMKKVSFCFWSIFFLSPVVSKSRPNESSRPKTENIWAHPINNSAFRLQNLQVELNLLVNVVLIGFHSDDVKFLPSLTKLIRTRYNFSHPVFLMTSTQQKRNETLDLSYRMHFHINYASDMLSKQVYSLFYNSTLNDSNKISLQQMRSVIHRDFEYNAVSYTVYIINPFFPPVKTKMQYEYVQSKMQVVSDQKNSVYASLVPNFSGNVYIDSWNPYLWIDVGDIYSDLHRNSGDVSNADVNADLADMIYNITKDVISSPYIPPSYLDFQEVLIQLVYITTSAKDIGSQEYATQLQKDVNYFIQPHQSLKVVVKKVQFDLCLTCQAAFNQALDHDRGSLNSTVLSSIMRDFLKRDLDSAGIDKNKYIKSLPVLIFNIDPSQPILLDGLHQAKSLSEMVLAVTTTKNKNCRNDVFCAIKFPLFDNILKSIYGTPQIRFPESTNQINYYDYSMISSFSRIDQAAKNYLLLHLKTNIEKTALLYFKFSTWQVPLHKVLPIREYNKYITVWNHYMEKVESTTSYISLRRFDLAAMSLESMAKDFRLLKYLIEFGESQIKRSASVCLSNVTSIVIMLFLVSLSCASMLWGIRSLNEYNEEFYPSNDVGPM